MKIHSAIDYANIVPKAGGERTTVIIPCYNEAKRLHLETFINFAVANPTISLVFIDDGSKDQTISLLCGAMASLPEQVDVLMMKKNGGKAEAVRQGLKFATGRGDKYVAFLDADLATPLDAVLDFVSVADRLDNIDVVFGSRSGGMGRKVYREAHRKLISLVCASLGRLATGLPVKDTQCGAKLFRNTSHFRRCLDEPFTADWLFDVELFLRISDPSRRQRTNFFEYPVIQWTEIPGSNVKLKDVIKGGVKMLGLIASQWRIRRKFHNRRTPPKLTDFQTLKCKSSLNLQRLRALPDIIDLDAPGIILDFTEALEIDQSVFTGIIDVCETIERRGQMLKVRLPDRAETLEMAIKCGLSATFDCTKVATAPQDMIENPRFQVVEF